MQMILWEVGGLQNEPTSSFSELSHLKALICKKGLASLAASPLHTKTWAPFTRSQSQGDFDIIEKACEGKQWNNADIP